MHVWFLNSKFRFFFIPIFLVCTIIDIANSQTDYVVIDSISIVGNKKTQRHVILREIDLHAGDTISLLDLSQKLNSNEKRLQSIGLFTVVKTNVKNWNTVQSRCNLEINVHENWYIYPYFIFELADRNFNVWRKEQNYSFDRVNYGMAINHINLTGNKDKLKLKYQAGFTRKYEITYEYPYIRNRWGMAFNILYADNREISYKTLGNKPVFYKNTDGKRIFSQYRTSLGFLHRTNAKTNQIIRLEFLHAKVDSLISNHLNPGYFGGGKSGLAYFSLDYTFRYDNTIYPLYPLGGYRFEVNARKEGTGESGGVNNTWVVINAEKHTSWKNRIILSNRLKIKNNFQKNDLPYFLNYAIGYKDDNLTGYQLYVMDGRDFMILNNALKFRILDRDIDLGENLPRQVKIMNLKMFFRFNLDYGYASDPVFGENNFLSNKLNYGFGPALDFIIFNNLTLTGQYGITGFGEKGFFFQSEVNF